MEFVSCRTNTRNDGTTIYVCKGCGKEFINLTSASKHFVSSSCHTNYQEDYKRFESKFYQYYIKENLSLKRVAELLDVDVTLVKRIRNNLNIYKDKESINQCRLSHIEETNLQRYGYKYTCQVPETIEKRERTSLEKYGYKCSLSNEEVKLKSKKTCLNRYGVDHPMKTSAVREKAVDTCVNRYGVDHPMKNSLIKEKVKTTVLKRYGVDNPMKNSLIKEKAVQTNLEKYGVRNPLQSEEIRNKIEDTNLRKYKVPYFCMTKKCRLSNGGTVSRVNQNFSRFLSENNIDCKLEYPLKRYSFDIQITDSNILLELNPTYTHNSTVGAVLRGHQCHPKDPNYHKLKTDIATEHGYRCIHVFDWDPWTKILNLINPNKLKLYARNCILQEITKHECDEFLNKYHLQNTCRGQIVRFGLYYNDELVQLMTFGRPRYNKNYQWELLRLCSRDDYKIVGGASKLFKKFITKYSPKSIISYCDLAKFNGDVYSKLGFQLTNRTSPAINWSKGTQRITDNLLRQRGADQLIGTSDGKGSSNREIMLRENWVEVYDCGQDVYTWKGSQDED